MKTSYFHLHLYQYLYLYLLSKNIPEGLKNLCHIDTNQKNRSLMNVAGSITSALLLRPGPRAHSRGGSEARESKKSIREARYEPLATKSQF